MSSYQNAALERYNYYGDSRVREAMKTRYFEVVAVHEGCAIIQLTDWAIEVLTDDDPEFIPQWIKDEPKGAFPGKVLSEACWQCGGKGTMVNPSIDAGGISAGDDFWDDDYDEETGESRYFRGDYDVTCSCCNGTGHSQDVEFLNPEIQKWVREMEEDDAAFQAERLAELRMGC